MEHDNTPKNDLTEEKSVNNKKLVFVLGAAVALGAVAVTIALGGVIYKSINNEVNLTQTLAYELTSQQFTTDSSEEQDEAIDLNLGSGEPGQDVVLDNGADTVIQGNSISLNNEADTTTEKATKNQAVEYYEKLSPNGENVLSDHFENKYINQIARSYSVESDLLVAIYSEPDTGNNFVLEFNGQTDSDGNIVKSPDTLAKVYQIDQNGGVKIATGKETGNVGVSYAEGLFCISMIKSVVMEQYPDYFTGLKK